MRLFILPFHILSAYLQGNLNVYACANILHIVVYVSLTLIWFFFFDLSFSLALSMRFHSFLCLFFFFFLPASIRLFSSFFRIFHIFVQHTHSVSLLCVILVGFLCESHIKIKRPEPYYTHHTSLFQRQQQRLMMMLIIYVKRIIRTTLCIPTIDSEYLICSLPAGTIKTHAQSWVHFKIHRGRFTSK